MLNLRIIEDSPIQEHITPEQEKVIVLTVAKDHLERGHALLKYHSFEIADDVTDLITHIRQDINDILLGEIA